jgi:hypothetical protein
MLTFSVSLTVKDRRAICVTSAAPTVARRMAMKTNRVTSQMVETKIQQNRTLDVQRRLYAEFSSENDKLLYAANAQARVEARRRITQQNLCNQEQFFEDRTREEHYQKRIQSMMNSQNDALAIEMNREKNDEERRAREIQRICEDAPELRDLERALKIAYMNKDRAAQHQEKLALMAAESRRLESIEEQMECERESAQKADAAKLLERKKLFDEQRIVLQRQIKEREDLLLEAQKQAEIDKKMVDEIVNRINEEDQEEFLARKKTQEETAKMVRAYEEQRKRELDARRNAERAEEEKIAQYNRSMEARNEGVAAKKQAKRDEDDRILAKIVEETEMKRREDEEFNNLRDMLWEEELEVKRRQEDESRKRAARLMKEEMMKANAQMMENKAFARRVEAEAESRMVELMKKKFADDEEKEREISRQRREAKMKHMMLIEKQREDRRSMYDAEKMAEAAETSAALEREEYRLRVIREARKRLLEEHAAKLQGFMPNGAFSNHDEFDVFQKAAQGDSRGSARK